MKKNRRIMAAMLAVSLVVSATNGTTVSAAAKFKKTTVYMKKGATKVLKISGGKAKKWTVAGKKLVKITKRKGKSVTVKAKKAGITTLTAKIGKKKVKCKIHVGVTKLTATKKLDVAIGETGNIKTVVKNISGDNVTFKSDNPAVATVKKKSNNKAVVTGVSTGTAIVTVGTKSGIKKQCVVSVSSAITNPTVIPASAPAVTATPAGVVTDKAVTTAPAITSAPSITTTPTVTTGATVTSGPVVVSPTAIVRKIEELERGIQTSGPLPKTEAPTDTMGPFIRGKVQ